MAVLDDGGSLECPQCRYLHTLEDDPEITSNFGTAACIACGCHGFIARRKKDYKVAARFPDDLGHEFVPVPVELLEHGGELGLDQVDRMIIVVLERHRFQRGDLVWPSIDRIAALTGAGHATVKRHLKHLVDLGLIRRRRRRGPAGRWSSTCYDLEPLWQAIADVATATQLHGGPE